VEPHASLGDLSRKRPSLSGLGDLLPRYLSVETEGLSAIPRRGPAVLLANHSGLPPLDALLALTALQPRRGPHPLVAFVERSPLERLMRPFFPSCELRSGGPDEAMAELERGSAVLLFPEGATGLRKTIWSYRRLGPFGRGGAVRLALRAGAPIVPVAILGGEHAFPVLAQIPVLARWLGVPSFPITPLFPWLGPAGLLPLPSSWLVRAGEPLPTERHAPDAGDDDLALDELLGELRRRLQLMLA
jgi:1-acyl-sn-glycerol-3-phosphate acyltransferase